MKKRTEVFINKVKVNTYIYTFTFIFVAVGYSLKNSVGVEPFIFLLAAFSFYALGRQVSLLSGLEEGENISTQPTAPVWVRGVTYFVVMLLILAVMFS